MEFLKAVKANLLMVVVFSFGLLNVGESHASNVAADVIDYIQAGQVDFKRDMLQAADRVYSETAIFRVNPQESVKWLRLATQFERGGVIYFAKALDAVQL